jgi:hypothetical protein
MHGNHCACADASPSGCRASFAPSRSAFSLASVVSHRIGATPQLIAKTSLRSSLRSPSGVMTGQVAIAPSKKLPNTVKHL